MSLLLQGAGSAGFANLLPGGVVVLADYNAAQLKGAGTPDGPLATWPDQSGLGSRDLTQSTALLRPQFVAAGFGGRGAVRGDGLGARMQTGSVVFGAGTTWYMVAQFNDAYIGSNRVLCDGKGVLLTLQRTSSTQMSVVGAGTANSPATTPQSPHVYGMRWGATYSIQVDGGTIVPVSPGVGAQDPGGLTLLDYQGGTVSANADIGRWIVCQGSHTDLQMNAMAAYLKAAWGTP